MDMFSATGRVGPAYCTGVGKAMLAFLPEAELDAAIDQQSFHRFTERTIPDAATLRRELEKVRQDGVAYDREEHETGILCIATPIFTRGGRRYFEMFVINSIISEGNEVFGHPQVLHVAFVGIATHQSGVTKLDDLLLDPFAATRSLRIKGLAFRRDDARTAIFSGP